ncbi:aldose epimerase family protein [Pontiella sulfatireligans]|uniref:Aldose 1-epimerase n=1 Tax=Pontiella sulfatireligans TaxID=2750658 RepID=A0A6C2UT42_9BACT|nr:aldose epimerase family protein [Pontiella sulfatireligans]VGO22066.1 Aldose 1-epimerase [Pontiella sulfatireligans]
MSITKESFGQTNDGQAVDAFILKSASGVTAKVINYGATLVSVEAPDCDGKLADVVLGFDDMGGYQSAGNPYFGATCGRFANRIANGKFSVDGIEYSLAVNNGPNGLHGGVVGFDKKVWDAAIVGEAVKMSLTSPDGEEGYPGTLKVELIYSLDDEGALRLDYSAETDQKTILNLTNHSYFNLAGSGTTRSHIIRINADRYTIVDGEATPSGELRAVGGTEMDLLEPTPIGQNIDAVQGLGYDHNYCINQAGEGELTLAASVVEPDSGRTLECWTTEPGVQFYTANYVENIIGKGGAVYNKQEGFCLETQHYPDSPNHPAFPSTELAPGETYTQTCIYRFGVVE